MNKCTSNAQELLVLDMPYLDTIIDVMYTLKGFYSGVPIWKDPKDNTKDSNNVRNLRI